MKNYLNFIVNNSKKVYSSLWFTGIFTVVNLFVALYIDSAKQGLMLLNIVIIVLLSVFISFLASSVIVFFTSKTKYHNEFGKCSVTVKYGNIMDKKENVINVIPIDDDYTSEVDGNRIAFSSLHGQLLTLLGDKNKKMFDQIADTSNLGKLIEDPDINSSKYYIFPLSKLKDNKSILDKKEYCERIYQMLDEIDGISNKILIRMPLIGDGNARIIGLVESEKKLEMILFLIKLYDFKKETEIEIVLYEAGKKIDLSLLP